MLELAVREAAEGRDEARPAAVAPRFRWQPLDEPPARPRPRGFIAHLTAFFIAYHTA